jgi:hypothetical protein
MSHEDLKEYGSEAGVKAVRFYIALYYFVFINSYNYLQAGKLRQQGKPYESTLFFGLVVLVFEKRQPKQCWMETSPTGRLAGELLVHMACSVSTDKCTTGDIIKGRYFQGEAAHSISTVKCDSATECNRIMRSKRSPHFAPAFLVGAECIEVNLCKCMQCTSYSKPHMAGHYNKATSS